ncbi:hypothetical protein HPB50_025814 [Hyalomma asiaticum]|uniref:Uncharacterized protein n=1 Tax=Hyalomma asiaticum TaxID=266040 RepID=A0ACB7SQN6_HYAAI|nr:hypothetical protein HPB50_025814 [Hyalomma asiaticum]
MPAPRSRTPATSTKTSGGPRRRDRPPERGVKPAATRLSGRPVTLCGACDFGARETRRSREAATGCFMGSPHNQPGNSRKNRNADWPERRPRFGLGARNGSAHRLRPSSSPPSSQSGRGPPPAEAAGVTTDAIAAAASDCASSCSYTFNAPATLDAPPRALSLLRNDRRGSEKTSEEKREEGWQQARRTAAPARQKRAKQQTKRGEEFDAVAGVVDSLPAIAARAASNDRRHAHPAEKGDFHPQGESAHSPHAMPWTWGVRCAEEVEPAAAGAIFQRRCPFSAPFWRRRPGVRARLLQLTPARKAAHPLQRHEL